MSVKPSFFAELKRRNVYKVAIAYAVVGLAVHPGGINPVSNLQAPGWVMKVFVTVIAAGFPIVLVIAWAFEMTPEGMKRTENVSPNEASQWSVRKFAAMISPSLCSPPLCSSSVCGANPSLRRRRPLQRSLKNRSRCCRFNNQTRDPDTEYLSDGIPESIINGLSQLPKSQGDVAQLSIPLQGKRRGCAGR